MSYRILITGSSGLVGSALRGALRLQGIEIDGLDLRGPGPEAGDIRDFDLVQRAVRGCDGIVHLAAISRVVWGERDPDLCWSTNVDGLHNILRAATGQARPPWVVFASSREVYGQPDTLPATEDAPLRPVNIYGRSKAEGERLMAEARRAGLRAAVIRLSNVYGSTLDHADRVVPAFAQAAVRGRPLRVDGTDHTFDFTYIDDVTRGITELVDLLRNGSDAPPPIHFLTGQPTTLGQLASLAIEVAASGSSVQHAPPRSFDVARFYGSPERARSLLGWSPRVSLRAGLTRLINAFRRELGTELQQEGTP